MDKLPPEVVRQVEAAMGWMGLGDYLEANEELERIEAKLRGHPDVLDVRWRIYGQAGQWDTAVELAGVVMGKTLDLPLESQSIASWFATTA